MFSANENSCYNLYMKSYCKHLKKFEFISALFLSDFNHRKMMENERNVQPEWLNNMDSNESEFSGYSEDKIDSDRAYSFENDDSDQSGSGSEQEDGPDERWVVND